MHAAIYRRLGAAREVLTVEQLDDPVPGAGEVRVRVHVSGVNPSDWRARRHGRGGSLPFPYQVPHSDGAGVIDAVGAGVDAARVGQRVWLWNAAWQRPHGTAAQYVCLPARQAVALPDQVSFTQAAGLGIPFMTAWHCLFDDGPITGLPVLIAGGAGAVGNAAVQLAHAAGAFVIATVSSSDKAKLARAAGADVTVDYRDERAVAEIRAAAPDGVARIVELALGRNIALDLAAVSPRGTIVTYAPESDGDPSVPVQRLMWDNITLRFMLVYALSAAAQDAAVQGISQAIETMPPSPLPTARYPLTEIATAHEAVEGGITGKVLIDLP